MNESKKKDIIVYTSIIVFVILLRVFILTPVKVNGSSMDTTLHDGEIMILNKIKYNFKKIKRFDIVVVQAKDEKIIKRVIGLPGETLEYKDNTLYINGKIVNEPFINQPTSDYNIKKLGYTKIPEDCYFVMGDNRKVSVDSRVFGYFTKKDIIGSASLVLFPFEDFGFKK